MSSPGRSTSLLLFWALTVLWNSAVRGLAPSNSRTSNQVAVLDLPSWGVISVKGADRKRLLHGLASQSFEDTTPGQAFSTCFLDATGRVLHYARALVTENDIKLICEENCAAPLLEFVDRFIFPADKVSVEDESPWSRVCLMIGPNALHDSLPLQKRPDLAAMDAFDLLSDRQPAFQNIDLDSGVRALVVPGNDLSAPGGPAELGGHTVVLQATSPEPKQKPSLPFLSSAPVGSITDWHSLRTQTGRFSLFEALALNATALELGLMHSLHFQKGCYVGQEAVSKAVSMRSVRRRLVGLKSEGGELEAGDCLLDSEGEAVGGVSSWSNGGAGLGLLKARLFDAHLAPAPTEASTQAVQDGTLRLVVSGKPHLAVTARALPFPRFGTKSSIAPPAERLQSVGQNIVLPAAGAGAGAGSSAAAEAEEARKAAKLEEMARKVAALRARKPPAP